MLLGAVAAMAVVAQAAITGLHDYQRIRTRALVEGLTVATFVSQQVNDQLDESLNELSVLAADPLFGEQVVSGDVAQLSRRLEEVARVE